MAIDAIIRVSFQKGSGAQGTKAHQAVGTALVGHISERSGSGPFTRVNTAVYSAQMGDDAEVEKAIQNFVVAMGEHRSLIDFVSLTLTRHKDTKVLDDLADAD